jgi:hypothetical protein
MTDFEDYYWEDDTEPAAFPQLGGGCFNIYALPPIAAVVFSILLGTLLLNFAFSGIQNLEIEIPAMTVLESTTDHLPEKEAEAASPPVRFEDGIAPLFTPEVQYWRKDILEWSDNWNLEPNLVATVMQIESCGDPQAVSSAGAMGLFQVMPFHFKPGEKTFKPEVNAARGLAYLRASLDAQEGNIRFALAGYNAGITGAKRGESNWPAETIRYTYWGEGIFEDALEGKATSERLNEWLGRGGASLCRQAAATLGISP